MSESDGTSDPGTREEHREDTDMTGARPGLLQDTGLLTPPAGTGRRITAAHRPVSPAEDITAKEPLCFYLGTHRPHWLWDPAVAFRLCVSYNTLAPRLALHEATASWLLDSGAYTWLQQTGYCPVEPIRYVQDVDRFDREIGHLDWAAPQDWMCEPWIIRGGVHDGQFYKGTGLSVSEHQRLTVENYLELRRWWPEFSDAECPFMPPLQGWTIPEYLHCVTLYEDAGVDLPACPVVGLGSVCRRQGTAEITALAEMLTPRLALHGFGVKTRGLLAADRYTSADSGAWSKEATHQPPLPGHQHKHCGNCLAKACQYLIRLQAKLDGARTGCWQESLDLGWETP
jgi:hypothetical protein